MLRRVSGLRCRVCGTCVPIDRPLSWQCPKASADDRHHVLDFVAGGDAVDSPIAGDQPNPLLAFGGALAWDAFADAVGMTAGERDELVRRVGSTVEAVAGTGFGWTPFHRADALSDALGFSDVGGVWVKDETGNVAGSHKARHLVTILLHLLAAEEVGATPWVSTAARPPLAIASCGNAALAASALAAAVKWPIQVFVPPSASPAVVEQLETWKASIVVCPRRPEDPPGDPCVHRFREAVADGAVPFGVQGPENAWCLDGGRTLGWELLAQFDASMGAGAPGLERVMVQVGGGAFASCMGAALVNAPSSRGSEVSRPPRLHAVQAEGCAPLARAWDRSAGVGGAEQVADHWSTLMWPWDDPQSAADGILDDEAYDWLGVFAGMTATGGAPVVATETSVLEANRLARDATGIDVSHTGSAGLAGLLTIRDEVRSDERVAVVFSGISRSPIRGIALRHG